MNLPPWLRPSRTVPATRWRCDGRWHPTPPALGVLLIGLYLFGTGEALMVRSGLGVSPWTVLAEGISLRAGTTIGWATFVVSVVVLLLWIPLRETPGIGTLANAAVVAIALQIGVDLIPLAEGGVMRVAYVLIGIAMIGVGSGLYLTTNLGPGPRDGWMTGVHERTGIPVGRIRLVIEVSVLAVGWLLGGTVGLGTVMFALLIGPSVAYGLQLTGLLGGSSSLEKSRDQTDFPELEA